MYFVKQTKILQKESGESYCHRRFPTANLKHIGRILSVFVKLKLFESTH